ncbi:uncharacterized protein LOC124340445 isoform X1 [Daphnia pulicaria]|uniref:uncharacterized protein LOC124340445 isoform X1 n=1 Tax=Daphnia pulicaria TaxID=35523 RepID=UPI001EEC5188|nr:uncharacterized protein LOC124340445 isoform X1 [Daphnia pulicaria]
MPNYCCVPMCTSGYVRKGTVPEKVALFSTKDKKMQKLWMKYIPRKNYIFTDKSRVCSHHFADCDIDKGYFLTVAGQQVFQERKRWILKPGAIPKIFPNCPSHMTKVTCSQHEAHEAQHMPLQETEKALYWETGIINMKMFDLFIIVEEAYRAEVDLGKLNILDWFERSMETLGVMVKESKFNPTICCNTHRKELVGKLVLEYLIIRNYLETKKWVKEFSQQSKSKSLRKQAKVIS